MRGREPSATRFDGTQKIEDLTKSKNFCGKLLQKISFVILAKKIFGVRCTLSARSNHWFTILIICKLKFVILGQSICQYIYNNKKEEKCLEIHWSHFHLGVHQRILPSLEVFPVHTNTKGRGIIVMILAIQVRLVTLYVPPGSMEQLGTVSVSVIIVLISSCKWFTVMRRERVASSS